jgi:E3 ubiquitin-protein ligase DOA10
MDLSNFHEIKSKQNDDICRICFESISTQANPLVSLCKCIGSVRYIHFECLKDWKSNKITKDKSPNCLFYSYTEPNCC